MEKTMVELFAGVGGFRLGFERSNEKWNTVWFSQWEPGAKIQWAHKVYEERFGKSFDLTMNDKSSNQDISAVNKKNIPDHTLLVGGFPCLLGNTLVNTRRGLVEIENVTTNDWVFGYDKNWHRVIDFRCQGKKCIYIIHGLLFDKIETTGNHKYYTRIKRNDKLNEPKWIRCDQLEKGYYLGYPFDAYRELKQIEDGLYEDDLNILIDNRKSAYEIAQNYMNKKQRPVSIEENQEGHYIVYSNKELDAMVVVEDGYIWYPIEKITKTNDYKNVYDISVEFAESFVANNCMVHNCQDYSVARSGATGIEGKKGVLWWSIYEVLREKQPPFCLFENVDRLLKSPSKQRGRDFGIILSCLNELGYSAEWRVINASHYGGAQKRKRVFIFAYKNDTQYAKKENNVDDTLIKNGFFAKGFPVSNSEGRIREGELTCDIFETSNNFRFDFENSGLMTNGKIYTVNVIDQEEGFVPLLDILERNADSKYTIEEDKIEKWKYLKGGKKIPRVTKDGFEYMYSEGPVAFPDYWDKPARTILTSEGAISRTSHIIEDPETHVLRKITPLETERAQGFDDNWTNIDGISDRMRYFLMGNALVVPMVTRMANTLNEIIEKENLLKK